MNEPHETNRKKIQEALEYFFTFKQEKLYKSGIEKELFDHIRLLTLAKGKSVRPLFMIYTAQAFHTEHDLNELIYLSLPFELMHTYLLIHDDVMDKDNVRHGMKTVHAAMAEKYDDEHFGVSMGILAGNLTKSMARHTFDAIRIEDQKKIILYRMFDTLDELENIGQAQDIYFEKIMPSSDDVLKMYANKTAAYTTQYPMMAGALLGESSVEKRSKLEKFARSLGLAFQIQDDIIGVFSEEKITGKPQGSDIRDGKRSYLILKALELGGDSFAELFLPMYGKKDLTQSDVKLITDEMRNLGVLECVDTVKHQYLDEFILGLSTFDVDRDSAHHIIDLANFLIERNY
jgi:geranylgeranyl diphosphate synthase, type I